MAEQMAQQTNGRAHIILLGRNQDAANKIIASFPQTPVGTPAEEESKYSFIKVDATSMAQVREVTAKLSNELDKINFIVASAGYSTLKGRDESPEGIDRKIACTFYARFRFIHDLAPLVEKAAEKQEQTGIMSVFAAGRGSQIDLNDLGLVKGYSQTRAHDDMVTYTDAAFEVSLSVQSTAPSPANSDIAVFVGIRQPPPKHLLYQHIPWTGYYARRHEEYGCHVLCTSLTSL
ncbi:hypothetical protein M408DRAFT_329384 [Serendipita vermifera MAFF 305830]|uniref:Ketoreductase (KR) domain-containing protein n=1 Tax=Serendipita vermifera MAFF 305830 TaxID=933852 RepID=A0A0C3BB23_SERVB|nr:hypothetical protein M408DRAFT_329384 [Serendipita vermifera MAFF 305830]